MPDDLAEAVALLPRPDNARAANQFQGSFTYGSVCSGIEAASIAWKPLGWRCAFLSEIDPFPRAVLKHHWPETPLHGDFTTIQQGDYRPIDLLVGGTPCQDFSIAGLRAGIRGERGALTLEYLRLADRVRPRWLVWENVPHAMSSDDGRALGAVLGGLAELGYHAAWRVLDAQYIRVDGLGRAVPQRRRRLFVVGHLGDWRRAAAVLLERASLSGNPPPRREAGQAVAGTLGGSSQSGGFRTADLDNNGAYVPEIMRQALTAKIAKGSSGPSGDESHHLIAFALRGREDGAVPEISGNVVSSLRAASGGSSRDMIAHSPIPAVAPTLRARGNGTAVDTVETLIPMRAAVRRLTPLECERLMGVPDLHTRIPVRAFKAKRITKLMPEDRWEPLLDGRWMLMSADGPRYKALGNSMCVNVMRWIGMRIAMVEAIA